MRRLVQLSAISFVLLFAQCSHAEFDTIYQSATVNQAAKTVQFDVQFNQPPDFKTTDGDGNDASAFQIFIDPKPSPGGFDYFDTKSLIRGVHLDGATQLPVLNVTDGDFGDTRGVINFQLDDSLVHFSAPFDLLDTKDGKFDYRVESYEFGSLTSMIDSSTAAVPVPAAIYGVIPTTVVMVGAMILMRRRKPA